VLNEPSVLWRQSRRPSGVDRRRDGGPDLSGPAVHHLATCAVRGRRLMVEHSFGGPWTERKLKCLRDYLCAYRAIFTGNEKARYFRTWYVDAFREPAHGLRRTFLCSTSTMMPKPRHIRKAARGSLSACQGRSTNIFSLRSRADMLMSFAASSRQITGSSIIVAKSA